MRRTLLTTSEVASLLGWASPNSVIEAHSKGLKPFGRRGRNGPWLYREEDVMAWVKSCMDDGTDRISHSSDPESFKDRYEKDKTFRNTQKEGRPVLDPNGGKMPSDGRNDSAHMHNEPRPNNTGGDCETRSNKRGASRAHGKRSASYYRSGLRAILDGNEGKTKP